MNKCVNKIEYIYIFLIVFIENSFWLRTQYPASKRYLILVGVTLFFVFYATMNGTRKIININKICLLLTLVSLITFSSILHDDINELYYGYIINLLIAFVISNYIPIEKTKKYYCSILYIICLFSFITIILSYIYPQAIYVFPTLNNSYAGEGKNYFLGLNVIDMASLYRKNKGVFFEHGMFSVYISIAIIFQLDFNKKISNKYIFVYLLTLISTMSTTGWIIAAITISTILFIGKEHGTNRWFKLLLIVSIFLLLIIYPYLPEGYHLLFTKFKEGTEQGSFAERVMALKTSWKAFISSPIIGSSTSFIKRIQSATITKIMTVTELNWFSFYGVILGVICNLNLLAYINNLKVNRIIKLSCLIILYIPISTQNMMQSIILNILIFYSIDKGFLKLKDSNLEVAKII